MKVKPWSKMPVDWCGDERLKSFTWRTERAAGTAALMLYFVICHLASEAKHQLKDLVTRVPADPSLSPAEDTVAHLTYDDFEVMAGLSRKLVSNGLSVLVEKRMIERLGNARASDYALLGSSHRQFAKLPGKALVSGGGDSFRPLVQMHLRSRCELDALKLYYYYAFIRDRSHLYSEAAFETIFEKTGVSERNIPAANALLVATQFLARIDPGSGAGFRKRKAGANCYYLTGYTSFPDTRAVAEDQ
ncbi:MULTISPECIES: hypothetical protein [Burkholderiaceae]|jgi:hypothetical protein|uniref:Uncharacterized protein n=2 Tax=Burkholderiaceae TaxID=119060 RepID=B2T1J4_PARPJ|nr:MULTISPECIES: hypothetical protein [Burkholderiaceae]MDP9546000.1 hypothetical protein [Burkholderia cepacia]UTP22442.1 hypothetical protein NMB33_00800 [Burkholderia sp. FXe9]HEP6275818.1 hypothetical protein [Burkholderia vietnamiensis]ACD14723.1 conserved hypothetical protein [Paraburkholderia phytofirmans PsJN]MBR8391233.1 hypothetical protein [Burkholderia cenocepacia]